MAEQIQVNVHYQDNVFRTAVQPDERADQLLLRSLYHFGIDPETKGRSAGWRLRPQGAERTDRALIMDAPIGAQVHEGSELTLEADRAGSRRFSTGSYREPPRRKPRTRPS